MNEPKTVLELIEQLKEQNIPPEKYAQHCDKFMEFKARDRGIPWNGHFELTPLCNLNCKMCYVHLPECESLLSTEQWKTIMKQAHEAGMMNANLSGGECLTYPGFDELYLFLRKMGVRVTVYTNGVLMDAERTEFFRNMPPRQIKVSLYGSSEDAYEKVTGKRIFGRVYDNLMRMKEAELPVSISITPSRFMADDMRALIQLTEKTEIPYVINSGLFAPRKETGRDLEDFSDEQYVEIYRIQNEFRDKKFVPVDPSELPDESHNGKTVRGLKCGGGRSGFAIKYDGTMMPCAVFNEITSKPLEIGFDAAWKEINTAANNCLTPMECNDCRYREICNTCPARHKNVPEFGHCDPRVCAHTKRLVQAGIISLPENT